MKANRPYMAMKIELPAATTPVDQPVEATMPWIRVAKEPRIIMCRNTIIMAATTTDQPANFLL